MIRVPYTPSTEATIVADYESQGYALRGHQNIVTGNFLIFGPPHDYTEQDEPNPNGTWAFNNKQQWIDEVVKPERERRLKASSHMMVYDVWQQMTTGQRNAWTTYRQELRDLPSEVNNAISPDDINWPQKPNAPNIPEAKF